MKVQNFKQLLNSTSEFDDWDLVEYFEDQISGMALIYTNVICQKDHDRIQAMISDMDIPQFSQEYLCKWIGEEDYK